MPPLEVDRGAVQGRWSVDQIIDERAVRTLFQPIVHLRSKEVVGFEALSRGPVGSGFESPDVLFAAAARAGRLGELDWVCRAGAMRAAAASGLHPSLTWFVNVEPAGLGVACPDDLMPALAQARSELRMVLEVVERGVESHLPQLLDLAQQARADAWGVALDDVGVERASLGLFPMLQPDVVKLDMSLLSGTDPAAAMRTAAAVCAYAERHGAVVLAEGIETREQERLATVLGAEYGQGYLYGRPEALPTRLPTARRVIPVLGPEPAATATPYELLAEAREPRRAARSELVHITGHLEAEACGAHNRDALVVCLPEARRLDPVEQQQRYRYLGDHNAMTVVFADPVDELCGSRLRVAPPAVHGDLAGEWVLVVLGPHYAAAFAARVCPEFAGGPDPVMEYVFTHDRDLALAAGRSLLQAMLEPDAGTGADEPTRPAPAEADEPTRLATGRDTARHRVLGRRLRHQT